MKIKAYKDKWMPDINWAADLVWASVMYNSQLNKVFACETLMGEQKAEKQMDKDTHSNH